MAPRLIAAMFLLGTAGCSEFIRRGEPPADEPSCAQCPAAGDQRCSDDTRELCVDVGGCLEWQATPCPDGLRCGSGGACGADLCPGLGARECLSFVDFRLCVNGPGGFLEWSSVQACDPSEVCAEGACVEVTCSSAGVQACADAVSVKQCVEIEGELDWSVAIPCAEGQLCLGGACGAHACEPVGATECAGGAAFVECRENEAGFGVWSEELPCSDGTLCGPSGSCGAHQCGPKGTLGCGPAGGLVECVVSPDGFLIWNEEAPCPPQTWCVLGVCDSDGCAPAGAVECLDDESARECGPGPQGFLEWSEGVECGASAVCVAETGCVEHGCPADGAVECSGEAALHTCGFDAGGVLQWSADQPCEGALLCKQAACGGDACGDEGAAECVGDVAVQTCKLLLETGFLAWSDPSPCPPGQGCQAGACGVDSCAAGQKTCEGDTVLSCVENDDGFLELGDGQVCPAGQSCLGDGFCTATGEVVVWDDQALGRPAVTSLASGGFAVAWAGQKGGSFRVQLRRFDSGGNGIEDVIDASGPVGINLPQPAVVAAPGLGDSGAVVAWLNGGLSLVQLCQVGPPGQAIDPVVDVEPVFSLPSDPFPSLAPLGSGLVATLRIEGSTTPPSQFVYGSATDAKNPPAPAFLVTDPTAAGKLVTGLHAAAAPEGLWAAWTVLIGPDTDVPTNEVRVRYVPPDGKPKGEVLAVSSDAPQWPAVTTADDGRGLVVWDSGPVGLRHVSAQRIGLDGQLSGGPILVDDGAASNHTRASATALGAGWYVVWQGDDGDGVGVFGRSLTAFGDVGLSVIQVNLTTAGSQADPRLATLADGRVVVAWRDGLGFDARIKTRLLNQGGEP